MMSIYIIIDLEGEPLAVFTSRENAERWLEARTRAEVAKGYYGHDPSVDLDTLAWREGALGFVHRSFGKIGWWPVQEKIVNYSLDSTYPEGGRIER